MNNTVAIIIDTNFIIQHKDLIAVVDELKPHSVYVSQVSIDERIGQLCRDIDKKYDSLESAKEDWRFFAEIEVKRTRDEYKEHCKRTVQRNYEKLFGEKIIPYSKDAAGFEQLLERAYSKKPPFLGEKNASDKGMKDSLIWMSMLVFFNNGIEQEVVFLTNDKGFLDNASSMNEEFLIHTGKNIEFKPNAYYEELIDMHNEKEEDTNKDRLTDAEMWRDKIQKTVNKICYGYSQDVWGNAYQDSTFAIYEKIDEEYVEEIFSKIDVVLNEHLFESDIAASQLLDIDGRIIDKEIAIKIQDVEELRDLYKDIKKLYPSYLRQFYSAVAAIINKNYMETCAETEDDIPF